MLLWWLCCCDEADVDLFCGTHGDPEEELELLDGNGGVGGGTAICTVTARGNGIVVIVIVGVDSVGECSRSEWSCCCMAIT